MPDWFRRVAQPGDLIEVHSGSRFVGTSADPAVVAALVRQALRA